MSHYDLIAFDMDGTLLNSRKEISADSLEAIEKAAAAGKEVVLATGRSLPELADILPQLPTVRYVIAVSGALIYDAAGHQVLRCCPIRPDTVETMLRALQGEDVMIHLHSDRSYVQRDKALCMADYHMGDYQRFFDRVATAVDDIAVAYLTERFPVYKFNVYPREAARREHFRELFSPLPLSLAYAETASLECSQEGISKGSGLHALCEHLNIDIARAIAVGDSDNDLAMLREAGLAVVMGNGTPNALALADVTVRDNDHGGCAQAIYEHLLH